MASTFPDLPAADPFNLNSLLNKRDRLSEKPFASVPALLDLPEIECEPASVSEASSRHESIRSGVDFAEGCILTKSTKYVHKITRMVNAVWKEDSDRVEDIIEYVLRVIPFKDFTLDHPCNIALFEPSVHTSLDLYAFVALAPSSSTVDKLISMVKFDNDERQQEMDQKGDVRGRSLNFKDPSFVDPEYELIALHPEHFLPRGAVLPIYDPTTKTWKCYVPSCDRHLRESFDPESAPLPPFRHVLQQRSKYCRINIFLVTINAEIKFRRYFRMIERHPPPIPLPDDVLSLMHRVIELTDLLYWQPKPTEGSQGYLIRAAAGTLKRKNPERTARPSKTKYKERTSGEESGTEGVTTTKYRKISKLLPDADAETRKAYGSALMSGHDFDYDPALFENAFTIDDIPHLYSDKTTIEKWNQNVTSDV